MSRTGRPPAPQPKRANGEGSLYFDATRDRWVGAVTVGRDARGRPIRRKVSDPDRRAAASKLRRLQDEADTIDLTTTRPNVGQLAEQWWQTYSHSSKRDVSTLAVRRARLERHIINDQRIAAVRADRLQVEHVEAWLAAKIAEGYTGPDGKRSDYSPSTLASIRGDLSQLLRWAVGRRRIAFNPAGFAELHAAREPGPKRTLDVEGAARLVRQCVTTKRRWGTYTLACLLLGARPGEIGGLRWAAIDYDAGTVTLATAVKRGNSGRAIALGATKTKTGRTLAASPILLDALRRERLVQAELRLAGRNWPSEWDGLVFLNRHGFPPSGSGLRKALRAIAADAGLDVEKLTLYELRHSCASLLDHQGVPVREIIDQLGHRDDQMFFRHYRHRLAPTVTAGAEAWEQIIDQH